MILGLLVVLMVIVAGGMVGLGIMFMKMDTGLDITDTS